MFWKPGISYKMRSQNAANAISGVQILKIFWGGMPPSPPKKLVPSALAPPKFRKVSATD
jgi:hypothetical protein